MRKLASTLKKPRNEAKRLSMQNLITLEKGKCGFCDMPLLSTQERKFLILYKKGFQTNAALRQRTDLKAPAVSNVLKKLHLKGLIP